MLHRYAILLAALAASAIAQPAEAQNALGDGRALERNNQVIPRTGLPPRGRDIMADIRFRNAVVTGNAPGGLSFREDVGYTDPFEFRGDLASDDSFAFRRDSLYSGLAGVGIRGTSAIQYQFALTTGAAPPAGLVGGLGFSRDGSHAFNPRTIAAPGATNLNQIGAEFRAARDALTEDPAALRGTGRLLELRSTAAFAANNTLRESLMNTVETPQGRFGVVASPLRGIRPTPLDYNDALRQRALGLDTDAEDDEADAEPLGLNNRATTAHDELMSRLRVSDDAPEESEVEERLDDLRRIIRGLDLDDPSDDEDPFDADTLDLLREQGGEVDQLIDPSVDQRDIFADHMAAATRLLDAERFFDAEARFVAALSVRPGDPSALIGRVHAQLGAGLFDSAAVNFRALIARHPELAAVRYTPGARPSNDRLRVVTGLLRPRLSRADGSVRVGHATLLAYVSFQLDDAQLLEEALTLLDRAAEEDPEGASRPLDAFLRAIWTTGTTE